MGIEPTWPAWKAGALPLSYTRDPTGHRSGRACVVNPPEVNLRPLMNALLLTGGRVVDPANRFDAVADVLVRDGKVAAVGPEAAGTGSGRGGAGGGERPRGLPGPD